MDIIEFIKKQIASFEINTTKAYLVVANFTLVVFAIWFSNAKLLPFSNLGDFAFFVVLALFLALYRPSWTFAFFAGTLALENVNLAPESLSIMIRPYQLFAAITIVSLLVQFSSKRLSFSLPKWRWYDAMPIVFALAGFLSSFGSQIFSTSFKQSIVAASFVAIYYLVRIYVQSLEDLKRIAPFFLSSGLVVVIYGIWQNVRFLSGLNSFEVMPGRPNGTFTEPDWLGAYLVFLLAAILTIIYVLNKKSSVISLPAGKASHQSSGHRAEKVSSMTDDRLLMTKFIKEAILYLGLILVFIALILTVSRSAWLGAALVAVGFLKVVLTDGSWRISKWRWKSFFMHGVLIAVVLVASLLISTQLSNFQIFNRAQSTSGQQKITISCDRDNRSIPETISDIRELDQYGCKHINLEDIEQEKSAGNIVMEISRPDPSVNIRAQIYEKSFEQIKKNPIFGIGWGSISEILGKDENGNGLNASNIFLEVWLGSGLLGIASFATLFLCIFIRSSLLYLSPKISDKTAIVFVLLGWVAILIPNLFNSGIFLGFAWGYLAVAIDLLESNKMKK